MTVSALLNALNLRQIERYVARPLVVFFTFAVLLFGVAQAGGRLLVSVLGAFEPELNALLAHNRVSISGLEGDWQGFNPILRVQSLEYPAGRIDEIEVELDVFESIWRNTLIARRLAAQEIQVHVERTDAGWQLFGMTGQDNPLDLKNLLRHSDELRSKVSLYLHLRDENAPLPTQAPALSEGVQLLQAQAWLANRNHRQFLQAMITSPGNLDDSLELAFWRQGNIWLWQDTGTAARANGAFSFPEALVQMAQLRLEVADFDWRDWRGVGGGVANFRLSGLELPSSESLSAGVSVDAFRSGSQWRGIAHGVEFDVGDDHLALAPIYFEGSELEQVLMQDPPSQLDVAAELLLNAPKRPLVSAWLETLDLTVVSAFLRRHLSTEEALGRWVNGLDLQGQAFNVHAFYDPDMGSGYQASLANVTMRGYRGAPAANNLSAKIWGYERGAVMRFSGQKSDIGFPNIFRKNWLAQDIQGVVKAWFADGYLGIRGTHLRARIEQSNIGGGFAITRPQGRYEQRLSLNIEADQIGVVQAKTFVPLNISPMLSNWIASGPRSGLLKNAQFAYHGQVHVRPGELGRRIELRSELSDVAVEYAPGWPQAKEVAGRVHIAGSESRIEVSRGRSCDLNIGLARIVLHDKVAYAKGMLAVQGDASDLLRFVRTSPLQQSLSFVQPGWRSRGEVVVQGDLTIPIAQKNVPALAVNLDFEFDKMSLTMPEFRVAANELSGLGKFALPHHLTGEFDGQIFERPAQVRAHYDDDELFFDIRGSAQPSHIYTLLDTQIRFPIEGHFNFDSVLSLPMTAGIAILDVSSDLQGLQVALPGQFAKSADSLVDSDLKVQFLADYSHVSYQYKDATGWLHVADKVERGALGIGGLAPSIADDEHTLVIAGQLPRLIVSDWTGSGADSAVSLPIDWTIEGLRVERLILDELVFSEVILSGTQRGNVVNFDVDGPTLKGTIGFPEDAPMQVELEYLQVPSPSANPALASEISPGNTRARTSADTRVQDESEDPIKVEVGLNLPAARVSIAQLDISDEAFGAWRFNIEPGVNEVVFSEFSADIDGVHLKDSRLVWDLESNQSSYSGQLEFDDLAETLPKWNLAASLSSSQAQGSMDMLWQGSPLNVSLLGADGSASFVVRDGRFLEVEAGGGGLRMLSLINFTQLAKRINFDFSDVVGEGLSFEKISAEVRLEDGTLNFLERMTVKSSAGKFEVGGQVDLRNGMLDNEMIVTLPVSKSLPWYGMYLALANPLAGLGVVVGERVLRKPMEQFSTAKFIIKGTLDEPDVKFVSLWDKSMKEPVPADAVEN